MELPALNGPTGRHDEHDDTTITMDPVSFLRGRRGLRDRPPSHEATAGRRSLGAGGRESHRRVNLDSGEFRVQGDWAMDIK
jgi:hypothetical protein